MQMEQEIGKELNARDLQPETVVVIRPPHAPGYLTMWVRHVGKTYITFYSGELHWEVMNFVRPDGSIFDDLGNQIHVYEYLGEI